MTDPTTEEDFIKLGKTIKKLPIEEQEKELDKWKKYFDEQCDKDGNCKCRFASHLPYPTYSTIATVGYHGTLAGNEI